MSGIWEEIELRIRARYPFLYLVTHEEERVAAQLEGIAGRLGLPLFRHTCYSGFEPLLDARGPSGDPLTAFSVDGRPGLLLLPDFHRCLGEPRMARQLKDLREDFIRAGQTLVVTAPAEALPPELAKQFAVLDVPLPDVAELAELFDRLCAQQSLAPEPLMVERFARSAAGLTTEEARGIFARVLLDPALIALGDTRLVVEEKRRLVHQDGVLEFHERTVDLEDVGGLHALKQWLAERERAFDRKARDFGLPAPKGMLLLGVQGCGKSLMAKAVAAHFRLPLVRMDLSAAFGAGHSPEEAIRRALKLLEAMAPVVVWIDEMDKGFAGSGLEGGDLSLHRVFGTFITWLQEKQAPVFVAATANRVQSLPPELLRKGRFDELFFVDLPDENERAEILRVHLTRRGLDPGALDLAGLVAATRNFTGSELEQVIVDALYRAFSRGRGVTDEDLREVARRLIPLYNTYEEDIKVLRDWCRERTRKASIETTLTDFFQRETDL